jgi:hypothetical protein
MQRNDQPLRKQAWQGSELTEVIAKVVIHEAFLEGKLNVPKPLARAVHDLELRAAVQRIPAGNVLECFQRVHCGLQGTGSDPTVQGDSQAG